MNLIHTRVCAAACGLIVLAAMPARAQTAPGTQTIQSAPPAQACATPAHRQFDFWIGEWNVRTSDGKFAGINRIASELDGCVIHERYGTERGYSGESLNVYDATRRVWHQTYVDNEGLLLVLEGRFESPSMVLRGQTKGRDGKTVKHRITWTPDKDGSVRQHWESTDPTGRWFTAFDGRYRRR